MALISTCGCSAMVAPASGCPALKMPGMGIDNAAARVWDGSQGADRWHACAPAAGKETPPTKGAQPSAAGSAPRPAEARGTAPAARAQALNAQLSDDILRQRVIQHRESADEREAVGKAAMGHQERFVDVEKGQEEGSVGSSGNKEAVDFLGGFTIDSTFDPDKDV